MPATNAKRTGADWRFEIKASLVYWAFSVLFPGATYRRRAARLRGGPRAFARNVLVRAVLLAMADVLHPVLATQWKRSTAEYERLTMELGREPTWSELEAELKRP